MVSCNELSITKEKTTSAIKPGRSNSCFFKTLSEHPLITKESSAVTSVWPQEPAHHLPGEAELAGECSERDTLGDKMAASMLKRGAWILSEILLSWCQRMCTTSAFPHCSPPPSHVCTPTARDPLLLQFCSSSA